MYLHLFNVIYLYEWALLYWPWGATSGDKQIKHKNLPKNCGKLGCGLPKKIASGSQVKSAKNKDIMEMINSANLCKIFSRETSTRGLYPLVEKWSCHLHTCALQSEQTSIFLCVQVGTLFNMLDSQRLNWCRTGCASWHFMSAHTTLLQTFKNVSAAQPSPDECMVVPWLPSAQIHHPCIWGLLQSQTYIIISLADKFQ